MHNTNQSSRAAEKAAIQDFADELKSKIGGVNNVPPRDFGWHRRSKLEGYDMMRKLAELQQRYDNVSELKPRAISLRVVLLILPMCGRTPEERSKNWWHYVVPFYVSASKRFPKFSEHPLPRLTLRARQRAEHTSGSLEHDQERTFEVRAEIIGRAVLKDYREQTKDGGVSLDSSFDKVAAYGEVEGIAVAGSPTVRRYYKAFRRAAFKREFADWRAVWAQMDGEDWPSDQVWLSDFPQNALG